MPATLASDHGDARALRWWLGYEHHDVRLGGLMRSTLVRLADQDCEIEAVSR
jgi:hypothetical protein